MHRTHPSARTAARRIRWLVVAGLAAAAAVITVVIASALGHQLPKSSSTSASLSASPHASPGEPRGAPDEADGVVPDGTTVFDDSVPAVAKLDPGLLKALRRAAKAAADDGVEFSVNSGWRSPAYQDRLLREAVAKYGSKDEAARWVATAATSPHVSGDAVDIGRSQATAWLSRHGADHGLCQIYENEPWHYELRSEAIGHGCPRIYADPTEDPRMQQ
ncbi:M15 family metallopeptidase [Streptomyces sp. NPDC015345]|uniref:M15 family metallopeptidase n=1 Tax=Streptomyces sp. NPDC015345 TaxID=3364953 RepID=UPI0036FB854E